MRLYLAGPMTGYEENNFPAFNRYAGMLRDVGHIVINPAETGLTDYSQCMRKDIEDILTVEGIAVIPGWQASTGARCEVHIAQMIGIPVLWANDLIEGISTATTHRVVTDLADL